MNINDLQWEFSLNVANLIKHIFDSGYKCSLGEAYRTPLQAAIYAESGTGIKNSLHCKRLAIDLNIFDRRGNYLNDSTEYELFGSYWKSLHPSNRWGGDFHDRPDGNHFSMTDDGIHA